ncbi:MAG: hypothetical protein GX808_02005 [Syntrophomonadaceae bacterium]|nr:hypothetical protein [Syntrophomonadaceae bacterium]
MNGNIKNYLDGIAGNLPPEIISAESYCQIYKMADLFSDFAASEYIMETHLNTKDAEVDFSFRVLAEEEKSCLNCGLKTDRCLPLVADYNWSRVVEFVNFWSSPIDDIWFEIDNDEYERKIPQPCFFFNASKLEKGADVDEQLLFNALKKLLDIGQLESLWPNIHKAIFQLPDEVGLFQVGVMLARSNDRVRIFTAELTREQTVKYLSDIGWTGPFSELEGLFQLLHSYSDSQYILDFDVSQQGISEKIGINFGLGKKQDLSAFLDNLVEKHLCTAAKRSGVLAWSGSKGSFLGPDYGYSALLKDISHFKIGYSPEEGLKAKAYLRIAGVYMKELFKGHASTQLSAVQSAARLKQLGYKEIQDIFKEIAKKSMLDQEYRELCLEDSQAAIRRIVNRDAAIPDNIIFLEEDGERLDNGNVAYILPPFLKKSWLLSK